MSKSPVLVLVVAGLDWKKEVVGKDRVVLMKVGGSIDIGLSSNVLATTGGDCCILISHLFHCLINKMFPTQYTFICK